MSMINLPSHASDGGGVDNEDVTSNTARSTQNSASIATNAVNIGTNSGLIAGNTADITANAGLIAGHTSELATIRNVVNDDGVEYTNVKNVPLATSLSPGIVQPDNLTIRSVNGVLTVDVAAAEKRAVSTEVLMLGLPVIQNLYIVTRSDVNRLFYLNAGDDPAILSNWIQGASTEDAVTGFNGRNGNVVPEVGDYSVSDITGLSDALDVKQDVISTSNRLPAPLVGDGSVTDANFRHLAGATSNIQTQLNNVTAYDPYPGITTRSVIFHDTAGVAAGTLTADNSDTGIAGGAAQTVHLNLGTATDFAIKDGTTNDLFRIDNNVREIKASTDIIPSVSGSFTLGSTGASWDKIHCQEYAWSPTTGVNFTMPICVAVIRANTDGTVLTRSTTNLTSTDSGNGLTTITVSGSLRTALSNASTYWYTASARHDGDNLINVKNQTIDGCIIESRDAPNFAGQDVDVIVQVWVLEASI